MDILPVIISSIDLFLFVTYIGIGLYLGYLYYNWKEPSIGSWAIGSIVSSLAIFFHLISTIQWEGFSLDYVFFYRLATAVFFIAAWFFGVAHLLARRYTTDVILIVLITLPLGFILPYTMQELEVIIISGLIVERFSSTFTTFDLLYFLFFGILYLTFARDSHLIYNASIKKQADSYRKSIAIGHLFAWQFFAVGSAALRYIAVFVGTPIYFGLPFVFLLVPLLTLGSRPFDWAREGHEPVLLLLIDRFGTPTYSWRKEMQIPLFLEGSTMATITNMLEEFVKQPVESMKIQFEDMTLYTRHQLDYLSLLLTTGPHKSFDKILKRIHTILVTDVIKQSEEGIPGYEFPLELQWLLSQLIPNAEIEVEGGRSLRSLLLKSGVQLI